MISLQSRIAGRPFRMTPGAVTWLWAAAVMFAGGSLLSAQADPAAGDPAAGDPAAGDPAAGDPADQAMASIHAEAIRADMRFLADDMLEGRGIETQGYGVAARYMASQFEALGLQPAGSAGYLQNVSLRSSRIDESKAMLSWVRAGVPETLTLRQDYIPSVDPLRSETSVEAPVVFVGFGVTAKDQHYDDYAGIDAKGKIVAYIFGAPNFESSLRAHNSSTTSRRTTWNSPGSTSMPRFNTRSSFSCAATMSRRIRSARDGMRGISSAISMAPAACPTDRAPMYRRRVKMPNCRHHEKA
jgi:hypothetical protein